MAREKVGSDLGQSRFPDGTFDRIEALGVSRPDFVRDAVLDRLTWAEEGAPEVPVATAPKRVADESVKREAGPYAYVPGKRVETRKPAKRDFRPDFPAVLEVVGEHRYSARGLAVRLGWTQMRLDRVLSAMEGEGLVRLEGGVVVK